MCVFKINVETNRFYMEKNYKNLLKEKEVKGPKTEIIERLLNYSKFWSHLALSDFMEPSLKTSKAN